MKKVLPILLTLSVVAMGCTFQSEPTVDRIKVDLIGHTLTASGLTVWEFAALSEYEQVDIKGKQALENAIEYDVSMQLVDIASKTHFSATALVIYKLNNGKWEIVSVVTKTFEPVRDIRTF